MCRLVVQASARGVGVQQIFFDEAAGRARSYNRNSRAVLIQHPYLDTQTGDAVRLLCSTLARKILLVSSFPVFARGSSRISGRGRPITLAFRQLHAAIDGRREARRYWQGYLRLKTGEGGRVRRENR